MHARDSSRRKTSRTPKKVAHRAWQDGPLVVGWTEYVSLPEWGIPAIRAKMDTGARSSALHVEEIEPLGRNRVSFFVVIDRKRKHRRKRVTARVSRRARVRSSNGEYETRWFVTTQLRMGPLEREVEFSLVDRSKMIHRVLLGRTALHHIFIDISHRYMLGRPK